MIRGMTPKGFHVPAEGPEEPHSSTDEPSDASPSDGLAERITGALVGAAVGDALGGPVEGYSPEQITERHDGRVHGIVGRWQGDAWRTARPLAPYPRRAHEPAVTRLGGTACSG